MSREYDESAIDFPHEIFKVDVRDLIEKNRNIVQDFPLPRSIRNHVIRPSRIYYELPPQNLISALELRIAGRGNSRRTKTTFYSSGKFERKNYKSKLDFGRSVRILRSGSMGVKVTLRYTD